MLEKHVVSFEIAKKMKKAGWKKDTVFWRVYNKIKDEYKLKYTLSECVKTHPESWIFYSAPLTTEILEDLPIKINGFSCLSIRCLEDDNSNFEVGYPKKYGSIEPANFFQDMHLSNALAKLWIWRQENKRKKTDYLGGVNG